MRRTKFNNVNVTAVNEDSGNRCVNTNQLVNGKDFNFIIDDAGYVLTAAQVMAYIAEHPKCHVFNRKEYLDNETGKVKSYIGNFYLIPNEYIIKSAVC